MAETINCVSFGMIHEAIIFAGSALHQLGVVLSLPQRWANYILINGTQMRLLAGHLMNGTHKR